MLTTDGEEIIVVDEFRLHARDTDGTAARMVAAASLTSRDPPLLTSIEDPRDVALVRAVPASSAAPADPRDDVALGRLVAGWRPSKRYRSRIAATSEVTKASSYRLAITESGVNDEPGAPCDGWLGQPASEEPIAVLLVGMPLGSDAGLLVLVGRDGSPEERTIWPLPLSHALGVRIYHGWRAHGAM